MPRRRVMMSEHHPVNDNSASALPAGPEAEQAAGEAAHSLRSGSLWEAGEGIHALDDATPFGQENALQRLGKPPFEKTPRGRFRLLGYLATVYEHVSQDVRRAENRTAQSREGGGS
jgi:hypothetical protein